MLFKKLEGGEGASILSDIFVNFAGIMYAENIFVKREDIELYWSNKGQRGCDEHRLTVRYRPNKAVFTGYKYDTTKHSKVMEPIELVVEMRPKISCPLTFD